VIHLSLTPPTRKCSECDTDHPQEPIAECGARDPDAGETAEERTLIAAFRESPARYTDGAGCVFCGKCFPATFVVQRWSKAEVKS
jgi:hypothetical protein